MIATRSHVIAEIDSNHGDRGDHGVLGDRAIASRS
jgi:hypothetical protein